MQRSFKSAPAVGLAALLLASCGGGGNSESESATQLRPTVHTPDGQIVNSCSLDPRCSGKVMAFPGNRASYTVTRNDAGFIITSRQGESTPIPQGILRLNFDDASIALDINGHAGRIYRLYRAAFNRTPDLAGLGYWINTLDTGTNLINVGNSFYQSEEFKSVYGASSSHRELVTLFYRNILQREPDDAGLAYWTGLLDTGAQTPAQVLLYFSESVEHRSRWQSAVQNGITYISWDKQQSLRSPGTFTASATAAPGNGAIISRTVRLEVQGNGLANVELLPSHSYVPRLGTFNISSDGTSAWLDFDTTRLPNGSVDLRISAFNVPAGHPNAGEIIAMAPRRWLIRN